MEFRIGNRYGLGLRVLQVCGVGMTVERPKARGGDWENMYTATWLYARVLVADIASICVGTGACHHQF